jgi:hypothetical protein
MGVAQSLQGVDTFGPRVTALETYQTNVSQIASNAAFRLANLEPIMTSNATYVTSILSIASNINSRYNQLATRFDTANQNIDQISSYVYTLSDKLSTTVSRVSAVESFQKTFDSSNYANRITTMSDNQWILSGNISNLGVSLVNMSNRLATMEVSVGSFDYSTMYTSAVLYSDLNTRFDALSATVSLRLSNYGVSMNAISSAYVSAVSSVSFRIYNVEPWVPPAPTYVRAPTALNGTGTATSGIVLSMGNNGAVITTTVARAVNLSTTVLSPGFEVRIVNLLSTPINDAITTYNGTTNLPTRIFVPPNTISSTAFIPGSSYRTVMLLSNLSLLVF